MYSYPPRPKKPEPEPDPETPVGILSDPVLEMRFRRLLNAGYGAHQAAEIAFRRDIDLHQAEVLAASAGPELATEILL